MRLTGFLACIILLFCTCIMPVSADEVNQSWEQYFFLPADGLDLNLIYKYLDDLSGFSFESPKTNWELVKEDLEQYNVNLKLNFNKAYIYYTGLEIDLGLVDFSKTDVLNYDSAPAVFGERCIMIPAYADNGLGVELQISCDYSRRPGLPSREEDVTGTIDEIYEDFSETIYYYGLILEIHKLKEIDYTGAKKAYEAVADTGASIKKIMRSDIIDYDGYEDLYIITVEEDCKGYIYSYTKNRLYTFAEYMDKIKAELLPTPIPTPTPTPTPTRTPFWTPRPSTASTIKPSSNATAAPSKTAAASPSHSETASPELWASPSSWQKPSASYEPEQTGGSAAVIVLAAAAGCLLIGGIVWAIVSVRKKKP